MLVVVVTSALGLAVQAQGGERLNPLPANGVYQANNTELVLNAVYQNVMPSVVSLTVLTNQGSGAGSGFVIDAQGYIVTNNHVVEGAEAIQVLFFDGSTAEAQIIGLDPDSDTAVIKVDPSQVLNLRPVTFGDSNNVFVGQSVVALGNPFRQSFTMTTGIISAVDRSISAEGNFSIPEVIQTDAPINPGNSGGPLVDLNGNVVGMNTAILTESRTGSGSGVGFSVPANQIRRVVPYLIQNGDYRYSFLGISGATVQAEQRQAMNLLPDLRGVVVVELVPGGPAERSGLQAAQEGIRTSFGVQPLGGDIITAINGVAVSNMGDLIAYLAANTLPGDTVSLTILRDNSNVNINVTLDERPR
jgi:2-alkenal reductase